jgi:peptide deformylase
MIKEILKYPKPFSNQYAADVRVFNEELFELIDDLKDTLIQNNLQGLSAYQIGNHFNVIVIKQKDNTILELINPRLINPNGTITTTEKTAYFGDLSANVTRYEHISLIYEDRFAKQKSLKASGDFAILLQRKIDYTFGSTFLNKLSKQEKKLFEKKLEYGIKPTSEYCPTVFKRDYILKIANILNFSIFILLGLIIFMKNYAPIFWKLEIYISLSVLFLGIFYFLYGYYESRKYSSCSSCQLGNLFGTSMIIFVKLTLLMTISYVFIFNR